MNTVQVCFLLPAIFFAGLHAAYAGDALPSWKLTATKPAIITFVEKVAWEDSGDFVSVSQRIAAFDNDGTLWAEQPHFLQELFICDWINALAIEHPEWKDQEPFASVLRGDAKAVLAGGEIRLLEMTMANHAGMIADAFAQIVDDWTDTAKHPTSGRTHAETAYQPMVEFLEFLRVNGFKAFILSGGGIECMRPWVEIIVCIAPEQVVDTSINAQDEVRDDIPVPVRLPEMNFLGNKEGKPAGINQHIGRRPIFAVGNSNGDFQMLERAATGDGARLEFVIHHSEFGIEWVYDHDSQIGKLACALEEGAKRGWTVDNKKND